MLKPRCLAILDINDQPDAMFGVGTQLTRHLSVQRLSTWLGVQEAIGGRDSGRYAPDILLVDVSFDKDEHVNGARIESVAGSEVVPVGPLLSLTFVNARDVVAFAPYSAHMKDTVVRREPHFLIAMGLIAAKMHGRSYVATTLTRPMDEDHWKKTDQHLSLSWLGYEAEVWRGDDRRWHWALRHGVGADGTVDQGDAGSQNAARKVAVDRMRQHADSLGEYIDKLTGLSNPVAALKAALPLYRSLFLSSANRGTITVLNFVALTRFIKKAKNAFAAGAKTVDVPADTGVEFRGSRGIDSLSLVSLFADALNWSGTTIDKRAFAAIDDFISQAIKEDQPFKDALRAIIARKSEEAHRYNRIDAVIRDLWPTKTTDEYREIFRLCVLLANVHALAKRGGRTLAKTDVYDRLGFHDGNIYKGFFGARGKATRRRNICENTINVPMLDPLQPSPKQSEIGFLGPNSVVSVEDNRRIDLYLHATTKQEHYLPIAHRMYRVEES